MFAPRCVMLQWVATSCCYDMDVCFDAGEQKTQHYTRISKQIINKLVLIFMQGISFLTTLSLTIIMRIRAVFIAIV